MKLLTLNTHSLVGEDSARRGAALADALVEEAPDLIALQEVNQTRTASPVKKLPSGYVSCGAEIPLRSDNYALFLARRLASAELFYHWCWLPVKVGYDRFDEGLAVLSRFPIDTPCVIPLSRVDSYADWRTRKALLLHGTDTDNWFCNLHTGWWGDAEEPFEEQFERLLAALPLNHTVFLMGDTNNPAELRGEGYDRMICAGFYDSFRLACQRYGEATVHAEADGWRGRAVGRDLFRVDQIFCNRRISVPLYRTVFDGRDLPVVSDHFGVMITAEAVGGAI